MSEQTANFKITRWQIIGGLIFIAVVAAVIWQVRGTLTPVFIALALSYILDPVVRRLTRRGFSRNLTILGILAGVFLALLLMMLYIIPTIVVEIKNLIDSVPQYSDRIMVFYYEDVRPFALGQ